MKHPALYDAAVSRLIEIALQEDIGRGDLTTEAIVPDAEIIHTTIVAKADGVICGLPIAELVFQYGGGVQQWIPVVREGQWVQQGTAVVEIVGPAEVLLSAERTALNFLQRLSGIATLTRQFVEQVAHTSTVILDTRKTIPGWRLLDKYATMIGGAQNHRMRLDEAIFIKDNHIAVAGNIVTAIRRAQPVAQKYHVPIIVEVDSLSQLQAVLRIGGVDRVLLDNFSIDEVRQAVELTAGQIVLEVSGGVTLSNVRQYAETGVHYISIGALTHSAPALDLSLQVEHG